MEKDALDRQARALTFSAIGRDFQWVASIVVISNLVTLYLVSSGTSAKLATSVMIITSVIFALIAGLNHIDTFKHWINDMDEAEAESNMGQFGKNAPFFK